MTLRIQVTRDGPRVAFRLAGRIRRESLGDLQDQIAGGGPSVVLDLDEVTLVDLDVVRFLKDAACTVHLDGVAQRSCSTPVSAAVGKAITTIEGISATPVGRRVQQAWLDLEVVQCGYCQSGQIMAAAALLSKTPAPTDADIDDAMSGNVCRCGTYLRIREGIKRAARIRATTVRGG